MAMIISAVSSIGTEEAREPNPCLTRLRIFIPDLRVLYFLTRQNIGTFSLPLSLPSKNYLTFLDQALTSFSNCLTYDFRLEKKERGASINRRDKTENTEKKLTLPHFIRRTEELHALHRNTALVCSRTEHSG